MVFLQERWLPVEIASVDHTQTILERVKDGAENLIKNIKEGSGKVIAGVHM